ncbi:hypothetical protein CR159_15300 [Pollutimonas subterranea]|uniref:SURF1-like protein n=1 Tax=Pollutimonas subterranea TaxID=2045210 RepID=A0A2N4U1M4_9BURK|nr:SURF1 family protein [Pollutimonas subterranea]PLC48922.1 hypothetical protein CR159_15300 [Pollutimonas subterranea]
MARSHTGFRIVAALILLGIMAVVFTSLGNWQLDRAAERETIKAAIQTGRSTPALHLDAGTPAKELMPWRPAAAQGVWLHPLTVLLENRNYQGQPGYWVATPLLVDERSNSAVLVLRGWMPRPMRPGVAMPVVPTPGGLQNVSGQLLERVPRLFELMSLSKDDGSQLPSALPDAATPVPKVQNLDIDTYGKATGLRFLPTVLAQAGESGAVAADAQSGTPLQHEWPEPSLDSDKNRGYALQWFGFAAIAAGAWLVIAWRALRRKIKLPTL